MKKTLVLFLSVAAIVACLSLPVFAVNTVDVWSRTMQSQYDGAYRVDRGQAGIYNHLENGLKIVLKNYIVPSERLNQEFITQKKN